MKKIILIALLFSLSSTVYVSAQEKQSQKAVFETAYQNLKTTLKSQQYTYVGHVVYNSEARQTIDKAKNRLAIIKDNVSGTLHSMDDYTFTVNRSNSKVSNYNVVFNDDKQTVTISFNLGKDEFHIEVKPNGNAFLSLKSGINNISQTGMIERI
ncbi:hypothetical protein [Winogradskyella vidalii]|uniref:hypothetical protein n=1 Tax=Winogradskyella vidalii TaxID=2615024 RepID=UPI0015CBB250|nr:hypothetical protein [Winogradskyella vidalii]